MRYTSGFAAVAAFAFLVVADDAPTAENTSIGQTFAATLPTNTGNVTGSVLGSGAPEGAGSNIQISLYDLPEGASLSYGITANKIKGGDCSTGGGLLNPFNGATGSDCTSNNQAACQIGDLSGKHGSDIMATGGSGTGYYTVNVVDEYLSTDKSSKAFFGNKGFVIMNNGAPLTCANFIDQTKASTNAAEANATESASSSSDMATSTSSTSTEEASESASTSADGNGAGRATVGFGLVIGVFAALLL